MNDVMLFSAPVNPAELSVNIRYLSNSTVPKSVREEMDKLRDAVQSQAKEQGFVIGPTDYLDIHFGYHFENWRPDLDNPIKRSLDAISEALQFNDNIVVKLCVSRKIDPHDPRIEGSITLVPIEDVPSPPKMKRKNADPIWVGDW